jgi:cytochrome c oxidase subunit IV
MATGAATETAERVDTHAAADAHHPTDGAYIRIAIILAVITGAEVATYYVELSSTALILVLMPMMVVKFAMVAWFFMHLKQDSRLFSRLFVAGIVLAAIVYMIVLLAFDEFF